MPSAKKAFFQASAQPLGSGRGALVAVLEGEGVAGLVEVGRFGVAHQIAEVEKVLLGRRALGEAHVAPLGDELGSGHGFSSPGRPHHRLRSAIGGRGLAVVVSGVQSEEGGLLRRRGERPGGQQRLDAVAQQFAAPAGEEGVPVEGIAGG